MKRTVKRYSLKINGGKWQQLCHIAHLYRDEKNFHLQHYNQDENFSGEKDERKFRDILVGQKYKSATKLQARQWKIAQKNAFETVEKNWCALSVELKPLIAKHKGVWSDAEMHYAYWLVYSDKRLASLISDAAPEPDNFELMFGEKKRVRNYLRRIVRRKRGNRPVAKLTRSFTLDADMYSVVEKIGWDKKKKQFLEIMSLTPRKRIVIPLTGYTNITGNIPIVLDFFKQRAEVHVTYTLELQKIDPQKPIIAVDAGVSEVFMDESGNAYEPTFGKTFSKASKQLNKTGKSRNAAYVLRNKSSKHKAHRIQKNNLGKEKLRDRKRKAKIRIEQQISHAIHQVVDVYPPSMIITEHLDIRGKAQSKGMSRLVSYWMRGSLKERFDFMALVERFHHEQVNPAYTSQMCPICLFVHKKNRKGDIFQCLHCGHRDYADRVAAINLKARYYDSEITIYTPKSVVKSILLRRFIASLEKLARPPEMVDGLTVSGRTDMDLFAMSERNAVTQSPH